MKNLFVILAIICLSSSVLNKKAHECDSAGKFKCAETQTCCRSKINPNGWACFPTVEGVCCSDGISCCPKNNICNLQEKRCVPKVLAFLTEEPAMIASSPIEAIPVAEAIMFAQGFVDGLEIFNNLPDAGKCQASPEMINDLLEVINAIRNFDWRSGNYADLFVTIVTKTADYIQRSKELAGPCAAYQQEIVDVFNKVYEHITTSKFAQDLVIHTITHISDFQKLLAKGEEDFKNGNFQNSGKDFGALLNTFLLFDFNKTYEFDESKLVGSAADIIKCARAAVEDVPKVIKTIEEIVALVQNHAKYEEIAAKALEIAVVGQDLVAKCANIF